MKTATAFRALGIGAVSGLRTMTGPAAALAGNKQLWARVLPLLAVGEFVADKLPGTPSRTRPPLLAGRALAGGVSGWIITDAEGEDARVGALLGIAGAIAASYLGAAYRGAAKKAHIPDLVPALFEDAVAIGGGLAFGKPSPN